MPESGERVRCCSERQDLRKYFTQIYRVTMVVGDMGWVDYDFGHSTCHVLPRQMGVWQNWLGNWLRDSVLEKLCS